MVGSSLATGITSLCIRCDDVVAVGSPWWGALLLDLFGISVGAIIGGLITYTIYVKRKNGEVKERAKRLAQSVMYEVQRVQALLSSETPTAIRINPYDIVERLPTGIYDGLLNSAAISNFDIGLQNRLHEFYEHFRGKLTEEILVPADTLATEAVKVGDALDEYVEKQRAKSKFAWLGKMRSVRDRNQ